MLFLWLLGAERITHSPSSPSPSVKERGGGGDQDLV